MAPSHSLPARVRAVRGKSRSDEGTDIMPPNFGLAGLVPWAFSPRTPIRGHRRLGAAQTKTWIRGTGPRKTTEHRFLPPDSLRARERIREGRAGCPVAENDVQSSCADLFRVSTS